MLTQILAAERIQEILVTFIFNNYIDMSTNFVEKENLLKWSFKNYYKKVESLLENDHYTESKDKLKELYDILSQVINLQKQGGDDLEPKLKS